MSWKSVEMQIALPRTQEAGKHQDQMSKQNQRFQESLAQSQLKQQQLQQKRVNEFERARGRKVTDEGDAEETDNKQENEEQEEHTPKKKAFHHPFLGRKVDFSR